MCTSAPSAPAPPPKLPEAPTPPQMVSPMGKSADARRRAMAAGTGTTSTILTGSQGVTAPAATATKTLLGS